MTMIPAATEPSAKAHETAINTSAAVSTLFLGQNGESWDFWLVVSVDFAALAAAAIGVVTAGSIVAHKREAVAAENRLEEFKLVTAENVSKADERIAKLYNDTARLVSEAENSRLAIADANVKGDAARAEAENARTEAATAQRAIADANVRAAEAELKLEYLRKSKSPRRIDVMRLSETLRSGPKTKVEIVFLKDAGDTYDFAMQIYIWHSI